MKKLIRWLFKKYCARKHSFPTTTYIHRKKTNVVFEVEFNWYDEDMAPVSIVREVKSGKTFSIRDHEMTEFVELNGNNPDDGIGI